MPPGFYIMTIIATLYLALYPAPDTLPRALQILSYLIFITTLCGRNYLFFLDEEPRPKEVK